MRRLVLGLVVVMACRPEPRVAPPPSYPPPQNAYVPPQPEVVAPTATIAPTVPEPPPPPPANGAPWQVGHATWYGAALAGHKTSGERFDPSKLTAAHKTLKLGTWVEVLRTDNGRRVRVRINDRGPFGPPSWIIDVSRAAADELQMVRAGVVPVEIRIVAGP